MVPNLTALLCMTGDGLIPGLTALLNMTAKGMVPILTALLYILREGLVPILTHYCISREKVWYPSLLFKRIVDLLVDI
jgi:hypothetical protein